MREWMIEHPAVVAMLFGAIASYVAVTAFDTGLMIGETRGIRGEAARAASEAMGG